MTTVSDIKARIRRKADASAKVAAHPELSRFAHRADYARHMNAKYDELDARLVAAGWPPTSPWWREQVRRYFESGHAQVVFRVGRRGGKSSTYCRIACVEALYGAHEVPPGDTGYAAFISHKREEAAERMATIKKILDLVGEAYRPIDGGVVLARLNRGFKVYTATIAGVSGFTGICILCDEVAKWRDADTGANPATEVLASARPTMATMPLAKIVLSSSPMGTLDAHAAAFDRGDTDGQWVAFAPTWVANPTITEADTHRLEENESKRQREYGAIPMEGNEESLFTPAMLTRATRPARAKESGVTYVAAMDPGFTRNAWTFAIGCLRWDGEKIKRAVVYAEQWQGTPDKPLDPKTILRDEIAPVCREYGTDIVYTDQYEKFGLQTIAMEPDIALSIVVPETSHADRLGEWEQLERWFASDEVEIVEDKYVRADLLSVRQKVTPNGFTIQIPETPDGRHGDYAPTVRLLMTRSRVEPAAKPVNLTPVQQAQAEADAWWDRQDESLNAKREWWEA